MNGMVKNIRHIQVKQIAYSPKLFEAMILYEPHPSESVGKRSDDDELELQKLVINDLINYNWFRNTERIKFEEEYF